MTYKKLIIVLLIAGLALVFFALDGHQYLTLEALKQQQARLDSHYQANPLATMAAYFLAYVIITAVSLPGAAIMTLAGGALFGLTLGLLLVSFASSIGATLAFLVSRYLLRGPVTERFSSQLQAINRGLEKEGAFYLFTLRLIPVFPFFLINLVMGLTTMKTRVFYWVSQLGMLAGTAVYVNAGTQLGKISSPGDILSPTLIASFAILGLFPWIAKAIIALMQRRKVYASYEKPTEFDANLVVIGAGSGGLVSAYIAAAVNAKVVLIEKHRMGGDCLNTGCVPSKALIRAASAANAVRTADNFGVRAELTDVDFSAVMQRVKQVITRIEPHDSVERYTGLGVDCIQGEAMITSPWTVTVNGQTLRTRHIIVASGARPFVPPIENLQADDYYTSDTLWDLQEKPKSLVILGGGPIGCELAQAFARLGVPVTVVEMQSRLLTREDPEVSEAIAAQFAQENITLELGAKAVRMDHNSDGKQLICEREGDAFAIPIDTLLIAIGRTANVEGFGLETLGVTLNDNKTIATDPFLRTNYPNIFAVGDVAGPYQFTHAAAHQAWYAAVNALFGRWRKFRADYRVIPFATFTSPEIARVGLNESEAQAQGIRYEVTRYGIDDLDRAIADGDDHGFVKVLTAPGTDRILGATIMGVRAGELIAEFVLAMKYRIGLNKILGTIHIYPTMAEANKYLAGQWKQAHKPERLLGWLRRYHAWERR